MLENLQWILDITPWWKINSLNKTARSYDEITGCANSPTGFAIPYVTQKYFRRFNTHTHTQKQSTGFKKALAL